MVRVHSLLPPYITTRCAFNPHLSGLRVEGFYVSFRHILDGAIIFKGDDICHAVFRINSGWFKFRWLPDGFRCQRVYGNPFLCSCIKSFNPVHWIVRLPDMPPWRGCKVAFQLAIRNHLGYDNSKHTFDYRSSGGPLRSDSPSEAKSRASQSPNYPRCSCNRAMNAATKPGLSQTSGSTGHHRRRTSLRTANPSTEIRLSQSPNCSWYE